MKQEEPVVEIQCFHLLQCQDAWHMDIEEGELLLIDVRVQFGGRVFSVRGTISGEGYIGTLVEFLRKLASQRVPGKGLGVYP